jgi:SAM-dependent methyltransferase
MAEVEGARNFQISGDAYDHFMGRYSRSLAVTFADALGLTQGQTALDVGCGPGALTGVLVDRLGADAVAACDPSEPFVAACHTRFPQVDVQVARAEQLPFPSQHFDAALAQLVFHFVSDGSQAASEMRRVVRPGGVVAATVWDFAEGMEMLRLFWDAALTIDPDAPDEARTLRFGGEGELFELFSAAGLSEVTESTLSVSSTYANFDELWSGFMAGIGPAGAYCVSLNEEAQQALHRELFNRLGPPSAPFTLKAVARFAQGRC